MAMQNDNAGSADDGFTARVDQLLKSAIEEQEREQAAFMKVLQTSRDALTATRNELDALRSLVEGRDKAVVDLIERRLAVAAKEDTMAALARAVEAMAGAQAVMQESLGNVSGRVAALEENLGDSVLAVRGELQSAHQREEAMASMLDARLTEIGHVFDDRQQEVADAILKALDPVGRIMQLVQARLARAASDLAVAQGTLLARLVERDDRLERQRDATLAELLNEFAGTIRSKDRARIGQGLLEADESRRRRRDLGRSTPGLPGPAGGPQPGSNEGRDGEREHSPYEPTPNEPTPEAPAGPVPGAPHPTRGGPATRGYPSPSTPGLGAGWGPHAPAAPAPPGPAAGKEAPRGRRGRKPVL